MTSIQPETTAPPDDEISLLELWQVLCRRKLWVVVSFLVCVAAGAAYAFLKSPVYEASVKLRIGQAAAGQAGPGQVGLFEAAEELSARLMARYGEDVAEGVKRERPFLKRATPQKGVTTTVDLVAEADTPQDAVTLLTRISDEVRKEHEGIFERNVKFLSQRLDNLDVQRAALQQQYADATALFDQLKQRDPVQAALIMQERGRLTTSIIELDAEKPAIAQRLSPPQTLPTALLGEINTPKKPAAPKKGLVLALAAVLGLMAGVMLAFVAEYVANARSGADQRR
ncbi:MAG: hypothetical protein JSR83_24445 [Proteobacteria bacterium]|nr:hypothetical protein [Pseudomonadota bacterium]